jgi:hypothetical protein
MRLARAASFGVWTLAPLLAGSALPGQAQAPRNAWYRESIVNVHCDNHSALFGQTVPFDDLAAMWATAPVTMIQVSAQSNGYATYPTQVGLTNPGAQGYDTLRTFRDITRRQGKKLCVYMSVDRRPLELKEHPEWSGINAAGQPEINGDPCVCQRPNREKKGYLYERFLPQIREIITRYDPDGLWFDGDYILTRPCWCPRCLKEWQADTGLEAPRDASSPNWGRWVAWHEQRYREYRRLVAETIHTASPRALYTSNWSWAWTPEPAPDWVDTLSGDAWSVAQVQCVTQRWGAQKTPWDVMSYCTPAWRAFSHDYSLQRTLQEGALTMAAGGVWFVWSFGGGQVPPYGIEVTRDLAQWARDRQPALGESTSLSQVAVLDSETTWQAGGESGMGSRVHNVARNLAECHVLTDIVNEETFREVGRRYAVAIVPEHRAVAPETLTALREFVARGGMLVLTGAALRGPGEEPAAVAELLGLKRTPPADGRLARLDLGREKQFLSGPWQIEAGTAKVLARFTDGAPALTANAVGQGVVGYLATSLLQYPDDALMAGVLRALGKGPSYTVSGTGTAAVLCSLRQKPGQVVLHLIDLSARVNNAPADVDAPEYTDYNPALNNVTVTLPLPAAPARVRAAPTGAVARTDYRDGRLSVTIETMQTHAAVILETDATPPLATLPADTPWPTAAFHVPNDRAGVLFADDFETIAVGAPPASPWVAENRGQTAIRVTDQTAAGGKRSLELVDTEGSSFWPFLHRSVAPFRRGKTRLAFDLRVDPSVECLVEVRYEGKGAGPAVRVDGDGKVTASGKLLTTVPTGAWNHFDITFALGVEKPSYAVAITAPGKEPQTFADLPYATEWFLRCDSVYFVGSGEKAGRFFLDNVVFERLSAD